MAWNDTQGPTDTITYNEWNVMVPVIESKATGSDVTDLTGSVVENIGSLATHDGQLSSLEAQDTIHTGSLTTLDSDLTTLTGSVTTNTAKVSFPEAPEDGTQYARKDAGWEAVVATGGSALTIEEIDGTPSVGSINTIKVTNDSLTDLGSGIVQLDFATGGGTGSTLPMFVEQFTNQTSVTANHSLATEDVMVQVIDSTGSQITPDGILITDGDNVQVDFSSNVSGKILVQGGQTAVTTSTDAIFTGNFTGSEVTINHNLGTSLPLVQVYDDSGESIIPDITITDSNNIALDLGSAITGSYIVHSGTLAVTAPAAGRYTKSFSGTSINVNHNLNQEYPQVQIYETGSGLIEPQSVIPVDANNLTVTIGSDITGTVVVHGGAVVSGASSEDLEVLTQQVLEHEIEIIELQANATVSPFDHDTLISDTFSDADGYNDYTNTGSSTGYFFSSKYAASQLQNNFIINQTITGGVNDWGIEITPSTTGVLKTVEVDSNCDATAIQLRLASDDSLIATKAITNNESASFDETLTSGTAYVIHHTGATSSERASWSGTPITTGNLVVNHGGYFTTSFIYVDSSLYDIRYVNFLVGTGDKVVVMDLPTISGTVTDTQLIVREIDSETGATVDYDITDGTNTDTDQAVDTKNTLSTLTSNPTQLSINLKPKATTPTAETPSVKTYVLKLWKS